MRVLCLTTSFPCSPEDPSGAFVEELHSALLPFGIDSELVALRHPPGALRSAAQGTPAERLALVARAARAVLDVRSRRRPEAIVAHWIYTGWAARLAWPGVPVIGVAHGGDGRLRLALRLPAPPLAGLVAVAPWLGAAFEGRPHSLVCPMPVCTEPDHKDAPGAPRTSGGHGRRSSPAERASLVTGRPRESVLRATFVGRDVPGKGLDILLHAVAGLQGRVALTVVGSSGAQPGVRFLGPVPPSGVRAALAASDVLCVPSTVREGAPRVLAEAARVGCAVLASAVGGIPDVVPAECLVAPNTPAAWRDALQQRRLVVPPVLEGWPEVAERVAAVIRAARA